MPRKCKICNHPKAKTINSQLIGGKTYRNISQQFGMDVASVCRHVHGCLELDVQTLQKQIKTGNAIDHHVQLATLFNDVMKYKRSANKWLQDPDDPDEFTLEPRADEIDVIYSVRDGNGSPVKIRKSLKDIILDIENTQPDWTVETVFVKSADIREYALKVMDRADMFLDKFAKTQGLYRQDAPNEDVRLDEIAREIRAFLQSNPEVSREKVVRMFAEVAERKHQIKIDIQKVSKLVQ